MSGAITISSSVAPVSIATNPSGAARDIPGVNATAVLHPCRRARMRIGPGMLSRLCNGVRSRPWTRDSQPGIIACLLTGWRTGVALSPGPVEKTSLWLAPADNPLRNSAHDASPTVSSSCHCPCCVRDPAAARDGAGRSAPAPPPNMT